MVHVAPPNCGWNGHHPEKYLEKLNMFARGEGSPLKSTAQFTTMEVDRKASPKSYPDLLGSSRARSAFLSPVRRPAWR